MSDKDIATSYPMFTSLNHNNRNVQMTREENGRGRYYTLKTLMIYEKRPL